jgi:hypothetical protein
LFPTAAQHLAAAQAAAPACAGFVRQSPSFAAYRDHPAMAGVLADGEASARHPGA